MEDVILTIFETLFISFCLFNTAHCSQFISHNSQELQYWENTTVDLPLFNSLNEVLRFLQQPNYSRLQPTNKILYAFESVCMSGNPYMGAMRRRAFIAIEGNHRTSMDILSKRLAKRIGASYMKNPPNCLAPYRALLKNGTPLCKAYYDLGLYSIAHRIRLIWGQWNVVVKGYWIDQLIYTLSRLEKLPPDGSKDYHWPIDLLLPDLTFFIDVPHDIAQPNASTRAPLSWKNRCLKICDRVKFIKYHKISTANGMDQAMKDMEQVILTELVPRFIIEFFDESYRHKLHKEPFPR